MYRVEKGSFKLNWNLGVYIYDSIPELTILLLDHFKQSNQQRILSDQMKTMNE